MSLVQRGMSLEGIWARRLGGGGAVRRCGVSIIEPMVIDMDEAQVRSLEQVRQVLEGTQSLEFRRAEDDEGRYAWIEWVLRRFGYRQLKRCDRERAGLRAAAERVQPRAGDAAGLALGCRQATGQGVPRPRA